MRRLVILAAVALAACAPAGRPLPKTCAVSGLERVGGPISLVDASGAAVTEAAFADKPTLLYFGFANCPDVCPTSLQAIAQALASRAPGATPLNVAMITVDPERDTPELLGRYVANDAFPPGLRGLTGDAAQIEAAKTAFMVFAQRRADPGSAAQYSIDHSSLFYLMDRHWKTTAMFPSDLAPADMAACIDHALAPSS
jgi:protein SCO1/2